MSDFGQTLLANISKRFGTNIRNDRKLRQIANRVRDGTDYQIASEYAERLGELLSEAINDETGTLSYMSEEVAREVLYPLLREDHDLACEAVQAIQQNMYSEIGVGLNPVLPELDTGRIEGLVDKISGYTEFEEARWLVDEPIQNFSMSVVDQAVRDNAKKSEDVGLAPRIIRKAEPHGVKSRKIGRKSYSYQVPCKWCNALEGEWEYGDEPQDAYRRHAFCRCQVTYKVGKRSQDVWSKAIWNADDADGRRQAILDVEKQRQDREQAKEIARKEKAKALTEISEGLGVNAKTALKIYNAFENEITSHGLEKILKMDVQELLKEINSL